MYLRAMISSVVVLIMHYVGIWGGLYDMNFGFDTLVHIMGGVTIGFCVIVIADRIKVLEWWKTLAGVLLAVFVVGVFWEIFEYVNGISLVAGQSYWPDTIKDVCMDLLGAYISYWITQFFKNKLPS